MVYKFFDKRSSGSGVATSLANTSATEPNYQLASELHKQIIRKFEKIKVYSSFRDNISKRANMSKRANATKESSIYCVKSICLVNMRGLFL